MFDFLQKDAMKPWYYMQPRRLPKKCCDLYLFTHFFLQLPRAFLPWQIHLSYLIFFLIFQRVFSEYERESYEKLISAIEAQPNEAVRAVLKSFLHKIYKRSK